MKDVLNRWRDLIFDQEIITDDYLNEIFGFYFFHTECLMDPERDVCMTDTVNGYGPVLNPKEK